MTTTPGNLASAVSRVRSVDPDDLDDEEEEEADHHLAKALDPGLRAAVTAAVADP